MSKYTYIILMLMMVFVSACSANDQEKKASNGEKSIEQSEKKTEKQTLEVDKGILNVEITIPASMFEGEDIDTVIANAKEKGITKVTKNDDGSITYKMSKAKHKEMVKELKASVIESIEETVNNKDFVSIKDITYNDSMSEFTLIVDKKVYENSMDGFASIGLGMSGMMYQLYNGVNPDDNKVTIFIKDQATQDVFDEIVFPDDLDDQGEE